MNMSPVAKFFYDFILLFLLVLIIYLVFVNKRKKNYSKLKKTDYVRAFIVRYNLDVRKTNYKTILTCIGCINSFILAFTATLSLRIDNYLYKILASFVIVFALIYALYESTGRILKKMEDKKDV